MPELEELVAAWRREMIRSLPGELNTVAELEDHLRERVRSLVADGRTPTDAFFQASMELGAARDLVPEFARVFRSESQLVKTIRVLITVLAVPYAALMGLQFLAICHHLLRTGISPFSDPAPAAFFTNFIASMSSATIVWLLWRGRKIRNEVRHLA